jgi:hypothetical protein
VGMLGTTESDGDDGEDSVPPVASSDAPESAGACVCGDEGTTTPRRHQHWSGLPLSSPLPPLSPVLGPVRHQASGAFLTQQKSPPD